LLGDCLPFNVLSGLAKLCDGKCNDNGNNYQHNEQFHYGRAYLRFLTYLLHYFRPLSLCRIGGEADFERSTPLEI